MASFIAYLGSILFLIIALAFIGTAISRADTMSGEGLLGATGIFVAFMFLSWVFAYIGGI